ncbi:MAG: hypothetical protein A2463_04950 [Candidatus Staskawiczbacteria bacterium RIFOXYC2_FULL_32_10]|nr:MAG: hypothetical protein A2463_04950 [Candidatus Staskawiczbacteria bacterium RIFOXYC2_FULL_32_10]
MIQKFRAIGEQLKVARAGNYFPWETAANVVRVLVGREPEVYVHNYLVNSHIPYFDGPRVNHVSNAIFAPGVLERLAQR